MIAAHFTRIVTDSPQSWVPGMLWYITTQRISPASAGGGFYLTKQSEYNLRLSGNRFYESPLLVKSRALKLLSP